MTVMTIGEILKLPVEEEAENIGAFLHKLLITLWVEGEGFSGKRPFGDSNWDFVLYKTLVNFEVVDGSIDEYGNLESFNEEAADQIIRLCIFHLFKEYL